MNTNDRKLGLDAAISRRDFLDGVSLSVGAAAIGAMPSLASSAYGATVNVKAPSPNYPPSLTGMRGQNGAALAAAHALRDGGGIKSAADTGETYDLAIVGAGMSGLAAAYFYRKNFPNAKILILDNHDDFGGHARRNEMTIDGKQILINGGTMEIYDLNSFTWEGKQLMHDIGIDPVRFKAAEETQKDQYAQMGMRSACFFDKETFGVDRLVPGMPGYLGFASSAPALAMPEFLAKTPLTPSVRAAVMKLSGDNTDYLPGLSREQKIASLRKMSYQAYLLDVMKLDPKVIDFIYRRDTHGVNGAFGADSYSAWTAFRKSHGPGPFDGLDLGSPPVAGWNEGEQMHIHLPDGNGGVARLMVRWLIPAALPGTTMEDSIVPPVNYSVLDEPGNTVRIRLNSTVVNVRHDGDPTSAKATVLTYMKGGQAYRVTAANTVMACFNAMIPYICTELAEPQKEALHMSVRMPIVYTNVALRNWKAHEKLGVSNIYCPSGMHSHICLDPGTSLGGYQRSPTPDDPIFVNMWMTPMEPNTGLSARDQFRVGRQKLLDTSFDDFERSVRSQLSRALGEGGFDAKRDIQGIFVNRWGHGYAGCANDLFDPEWTREEVPWVVGRKRFGRIAIANSDAGAICLTQAAFDQANRAITEIVTDTIRPSFGFPWGERN